MIALIELVNQEKKASKRADKLILLKRPLPRRRHQMHHICSLGIPTDISSGEEYTGTARVQKPSATYLSVITNPLMHAWDVNEGGIFIRVQSTRPKIKK